MPLVFIAQITFFIQLIHSIEELSTDFHKEWYLFKMPFSVFLTFELLFTSFWAVAVFTDILPYKEFFLRFFLLLMFANGVQHLVWFGSVKKYVPGLVTAFVHVAWLGYYYLFY